MNLTEFSIKNKVLTYFIVALIVVGVMVNEGIVTMIPAAQQQHAPTVVLPVVSVNGYLSRRTTTPHQNRGDCGEHECCGYADASHSTSPFR